jgi:uncharacterized protein (TIGR03086 family)
MSDTADRFRRLAAGFTERVEQVPADRWSQPSPCEGWTALDVVDHLVGACGIFLGFVGKQVPAEPKAADDPLGAWTNARDTVQAALDDPVVAATEFDGFAGRSTFEAGVARFLCGDVLVHTWDLARATGLDERLDPDEVHALYEATRAIEDDSFLRQGGVFGPKVDVPVDADEQTKYLAFTGRRA